MTHHKHNDDAQALCPACEIGPFIRNNYFTGKLMLERDFTDEQRYFIEKIRHHHQRLHGWGVVCGLKVKQHANPACRDRFICIEPGTAIDCCGHEIVVREEECIDITQLPSIRELIDKNDKEPHVLQICLRYRECPTEEIPVLYDECGCDDTRCAPNRILESYDIDVMVIDPSKTLPDAVHSPRLMWKDNVTLFADVSRTAVYDPGHRMYLLVGDDVYSLDTQTTSPIVGPNFHLAADGLEMAVSNDGNHLFVVTKPPSASATSELQMVVLRTSDMALLYPPFDLQTSIGSDVRLVVASDDSLMALVGESGNILIWTDAELTAANVPGSRSPVFLAAGLQSLSVAANAQRGYAVGSNSNVIRVLNATGGGPADTSITILPPLAKPTIVVVVPSGGTEFLVVADTTGKKLYLVSLNPLSLLDQVGLTHEPIGLAISPGGHWAYILERKDDQSFVQVVDLYRLQQALPTDASVPLQVGDNSQQIIISASGKFLYIPFLGMPANTFDGGVAKIEVNEGACEEILWRHLDGCPQCDTSNCVGLATIENYQVGNKVEDQTDPPKKLDEDKAARIDNRKGRQLLPSTQVLLEMIKCLMQNGLGGAGTRGLAGPPGKDGEPGKKGDPGIDNVELTIAPCSQSGSASISPDASGNRILKLEIPTSCGAELTHICAINWNHLSDPNNVTPLDGRLQEFGLLVRFDRPVISEDIHEHSFMVLERQIHEDGVVCWCEKTHKYVGGVQFPEEPKKCVILDDFIIKSNGLVNGAQFRPIIPFEVDKEYRVLIKGDFIRDESEKGVDANHLPPWLPKRRRTGDGIEGGTFESWFKVEKRP
jgi:DNA-binding beta-propeller fold protein YncE